MVRTGRHLQMKLAVDDTGEEVDDRNDRVERDAQTRIDDDENGRQDIRHRVAEGPEARIADESLIDVRFGTDVLLDGIEPQGAEDEARGGHRTSEKYHDRAVAAVLCHERGWIRDEGDAHQQTEIDDERNAV